MVYLLVTVYLLQNRLIFFNNIAPRNSENQNQIQLETWHIKLCFFDVCMEGKNQKDPFIPS